MIADVSTALDDVLRAAVTLRHAAGAGRVFELFVMTSVARALRSRGYDVWLQRSDGTPIRRGDADLRFIQRGGAPSGVAGAIQGADNASSIVFQRRRARRAPRWEIWNGVQFAGRSGATHEIDLAVVPAEVGQALRALPSGGIPTGRPRVAIECKDVGLPGSVDEMRAFVARLYDVTLLHAHHRHLGVPNPARALHPDSPTGPRHRASLTYWIENRRTLNVIARRTGFVAGAAALTRYHAIEPHGSITVGSPDAARLVGAVVDWIVSHRL